MGDVDNAVSLFLRFFNEIQKLKTPVKEPIVDFAVEFLSFMAFCVVTNTESAPNFFRHTSAIRLQFMAIVRKLLLAEVYGSDSFDFQRIIGNEEVIDCCHKLKLELKDNVPFSGKKSLNPAVGVSEENRKATNDFVDEAINLSSTKHPNTVLELCEKALLLDPENEAAWCIKGNCFDALKRSEEALKCYDVAIKLNMNHASAWYNKGICLRKLGLTDEAIRCYEEALRIDPNDVNAWCNKGVCLRSIGRVEEAIVCYDNALKIDPKRADVLTNKGIALYSLGRILEAMQCYKKASLCDT
jgi:tetratricopeptide (TPR) repeat protein